MNRCCTILETCSKMWISRIAGQPAFTFKLCSVLQGHFLVGFWKFKLCPGNHVIYWHSTEISNSVNKSLSNNESGSVLGAVWHTNEWDIILVPYSSQYSQKGGWTKQRVIILNSEGCTAVQGSIVISRKECLTRWDKKLRKQLRKAWKNFKGNSAGAEACQLMREAKESKP